MGIRIALIAATLQTLAAQGPVIRTSILTPSHTGQTAVCSWARIDAPETGARRHLQLAAAGAKRVWLNGVQLQGDAPDGYDIAWIARRRNVVVRQPPGPVELRVTPRVFVNRIEPAAGSRKLLVWITNTLENTSNVFVSLRTGDEPADLKTVVEVSATVPPGVTQIVELRVPEHQRGASLWVVLDKEEEAMEGAYQHRTAVPGPLPW